MSALPQHVYDEEELAILRRRLRECERAPSEGRVIDQVRHDAYCETIRQEIARLEKRLETDREGV